MDDDVVGFCQVILGAGVGAHVGENALEKGGLLAQERGMKLSEMTSNVEKANSHKQIILERKKYEFSSDEIHKNVISLKEEELKLKNQVATYELSIDSDNASKLSLICIFKEIISSTSTIPKVSFNTSSILLKSKSYLFNLSYLFHF